MSAEDNTNGPWRITSAREVFDNPWINVKDHAVVHPDGSPGQYGVIRFKNLAIGVLPIDADGCTVLVGQHRFPHNSYSWELPEGGGALTVPPVEAAKRELEEETGLKAQSWAPLCDFDISNSITDEKAVCFLAWDLALGNAQPDPSEALTIKRVSLSMFAPSNVLHFGFVG